VLQINPRSYKAYSFRGRAYAGLAKYPEAIADYDRYLAANPNDAQMLIFRGGAHWYLKHYDQAVADFSKSISINPQECSGEAYFYRAKVYDAQGKTGLAAADREQAADQGYKP
jgi:tetratricopeptide (TPR) repeat protein